MLVARRRDVGRAEALHAVGALLHDAAAAHGHFGVVEQTQTRRVVVRVLQEVEAAHLVGTVVGAVARADAAVVNHVVESVAAVDRGLHRADHLARRGLAVHARHRLEKDLRILERNPRIADRTVEVAVHAQPVHFPAALHLVLADDRDVVLRLAGDYTGAAPGADCQVDGHGPLVAGGVARCFVVKRQGPATRRAGHGRLLHRAAADDLAVLHQVVVLGRRQRRPPVGRPHHQAGTDPRRG